MRPLRCSRPSRLRCVVRAISMIRSVPPIAMARLRASWSWGGRRVRVRKPRVRSVDGQELKLPTWEQFSNEDPLDQRATEQMLVGVSTRKYARSLEPLPDDLDSFGTSKSAVSRRFVR